MRALLVRPSRPIGARERTSERPLGLALADRGGARATGVSEVEGPRSVSPVVFRQSPPLAAAVQERQPLEEVDVLLAL